MSAAIEIGRDAGAGDPIAEAALKALTVARKNGPDESKGDLLEGIERLADQGNPACQAFVAAAFTHPQWLDTELLKAGQHVGLALAAPTGAVLLLSGLLEVFAVGSIAEVLDSTQQLSHRTWQRMLETGRFIRDIHSPGSLAPYGEGLRSMARIRIIHAMVRTRLQAQGREVLTPTEMAFTLCAHSHVVRRGLSSIGIELTSWEARAHQHLWRVVGHFMGMDSRILPRSPQAERGLYERLYPQLVDGPRSSSRRLTMHAVETVAKQAHLPQGLVRATVHRLVGESLATQLGVADGGRWSSVVSATSRVMAALNRVRQIAPLFTRGLASAGHAFANAVLDEGASTKG